MQTRQSLLLTVLLSTATLGVCAGAAFAADVDAVYGRSSEQSAMGEAVAAPAADDADSAYGRASEATPAPEQPGLDLAITLEQGARRDDPPLVDAWPGRAAAPMEEDAKWKISTHGAGGSGSPRG
jgi:hypothetical protein